MLKHTQLSYWEHKSFLNDIDFLIVGAGIVGYSCALHLMKRFPNASIVIIERGYLPSGASSKNAGFACFGSPTEIWDDLRHMPENMVWETVEKRYEGLNYMKELVGKRDFSFEQNGSWDLISDVESNTYKETRGILDYLNENIRKITGENNVYTEDKNVSSKFGFKGFTNSFYNRLEAQIDTSQLNQILYQRSIERGVRVLFAHEVVSWEQLSDGIKIDTPHGSIRTKK